MIIVRYLTRQVLQITLAITFVLLIIVVVGRFLKYLAQASQGELDPSVLVLLMSYRLPEFLQLIIPLALMLGILLAYGRMYADSEMTVLIACGLSRRRLLGVTLISSGFCVVLVALLALRITPWGLVNSQTLLESQKDLTEFEVLVPGLFQNISRGERTTYTENIDENLMENIFMYETQDNRITVAKSAIPAEDEEGSRFILFREGSLSSGLAGQEEYSFTGFDEMGIRIPGREINFEITLEEKAMGSAQLFGSGQLTHLAELQWRISLILLIPVLTLITVPLSRVSPRDGGFARLVPAILIYISYFGLLLACRDLISRGILPPLVGMWWVHGLFLLLGLLMMVDKLKSPADYWQGLKNTLAGTS